MKPLDGHVALITGGNSGIGLGMARGLAAAGADIAVWGTNPEKNQAAAETLAGAGTRVHVERCDVSSEEAVDGAFARTVEALGRIDSVFANAGVTGKVNGLAQTSLDEWRRIMAVNLDGTFLTLRAGARYLIERNEGGSMVAVSSVSAIHGAPHQPHYAASKTALLGLVRSLAVDLARHRIRVNTLIPGWTDTDLLAGAKADEKFVTNTTVRTPVRRWADPSEFGRVAVYLADPSITFHTGDSLVLDGGYTLY